MAADATDPGETLFRRVQYHGVITALVILATLMQSLDITIASVALPRVQGTLSATQEEMGWVLTSYIVASAIMIPLAGWLAGQFGRRKVFLVSIFVFTVASMLCGMAQSLPQLVLFRTLQGMGGAALVPLSQALLFDINHPRDFGRAMSLWSIGITLGPVLGPTLGGWLTENYSWRWVFYINLPIGFFTFFGLFLTMPENRNAQGGRFDFLGFASLIVAIAALQVMLDRGQMLDWFSSPEIVIEAVVAATAFYVFLVHTFSTTSPFLNLALFKDRNFIAANIANFLIGVVLFASLALLPPLLQNQMGYPVGLTGLVSAPRGIGILAGSLIVGRLMKHVDARLLMAAGFVLVAYSRWQMTQFSLQMDTRPVIVAGVLQGLGLGLINVPLAVVGFSTLAAYLRNEGTTFANLLRNVGSSIGISVVSFLLTRNIQRLHASLGEHITPYNVTANPAALAAHVQTGSLQGLAGLDQMVTTQATMNAYIQDFQLMGLLTLAIIPFLLLIRSAGRAVAEPPVVLE